MNANAANPKSSVWSLLAAVFWFSLLVGIFIYDWISDPLGRSFVEVVLPEIGVAVLIAVIVAAILARRKRSRPQQQNLNPLNIIKK